MSLRVLSLVFICGTILIVSCSGAKTTLPGQEEEEEVVIPHALPNYEAIIVDTAKFPSAVEQNTAAKTVHRDTYFVVNSAEEFAAARLDIAIAALAASVSVEPTQDDDDENLFSWEIAFSKNDIEYSGMITGLAADSIINWTVTLSTNPVDVLGCCTDFVWMTGSYTVPTAGNWTINDFKASTTPTPLAYVDWSLADLLNRKLTLYVKKVDSEFSLWQEEGVLSFAKQGTANTMIVHQNPTNNDSFTIDWDQKTGVGKRVDGAAAAVCWGADLTNKETCD